MYKVSMPNSYYYLYMHQVMSILVICDRYCSSVIYQANSNLEIALG